MSTTSSTSSHNTNLRVLENINLPTVVADSRLNITGVNEAVLKLFGYEKREDLVGENVKILIPRDSIHYKNHDKYIENYRKSGRKRLMDTPRILPAQTKSGTTIMVELQLSQSRSMKLDEDYGSQGSSHSAHMDDSATFFASFHPVSSLSSSFEHLGLAVVVMDTSCIITSVNNAALQFLGNDDRLGMLGMDFTRFLLDPVPAAVDPGGSHVFVQQFQDPRSTLVPKTLLPTPLRMRLRRHDNTEAACEIVLSEDRSATTASRYFASIYPAGSHTAGGEHDSDSSERSMSSDSSILKDQIKIISKRLEDERLRRYSLEEECKALRHQLELAATPSSSSDSQAANAAQSPVRFPVILIKDLKILEKIGSGGFAKVYRAIWLGKEVAVKKLRSDINASIQASFIKEMSLLSTFRHPNIVLMLGACHTPKGDAIVTEYLRGGSLFHYLKTLASQGRLITAATMRTFALDIAMGMAYLHSMNPPVIHRDLKSLNVLIDENDHCKVADFGLSREMIDSGLASASMGTPHWIAPEVLRGQQYTEKIDIYSYAIILWEMLTTERPFASFDTFALINKMLNEKEFRLTIPDWVNPVWADLIKRCWSEDPKLRPKFTEIIEYIQANVPPL